MDCVRAVIVGAEGTPYHDGLFFFDVCFPSGYPNVPPENVLFVFWNRLQSARLEDLRPKVNGKRSGIEKQKGLEKAAKLQNQHLGYPCLFAVSPFSQIQYLGHSSSLYLSEKTDMFYATQKRMLPNAYWLFTVYYTSALPLASSLAVDQSFSQLHLKCFACIRFVFMEVISKGSQAGVQRFDSNLWFWGLELDLSSLGAVSFNSRIKSC
ncbi:hypothetical protein ACFX12_032971 [Malus domestica]